MKKPHLILAIFTSLTILTVIVVGLISFYNSKKNALAQGYCETPPGFGWGTIVADTTYGPQVHIYNTSTYAFQAGRTTMDCPPPMYGEVPSHQSLSVEKVGYMFNTESAFTWLTQSSEWQDQPTSCDLGCGYDCCSEEYWINFTRSVPAGASFIIIRTEGRLPDGDTWWEETDLDLHCNCLSYGRGWATSTWWGSCSDCTSNTDNYCTPCSTPLAYCDGCLWDYRFDPFRDEYYTGTGPGHKCPGKPRVCAKSSNWCEGNTLWHCSTSDDCSKTSENCGASAWTSSYQCNSNWRQRQYTSQGCKDAACYGPSNVWYDVENCDVYDGWYSGKYRDYYCSSLNGNCVFNTYPDVPELKAPPNSPG
jgi:hypothetical protein